MRSLHNTQFIVDENFFLKNRTNILIILIFLILPFIFFEGSFNLSSIILGMRDAQVGFFPALDLKVQIVKNLELPLWDRYIFSGYPMLSTPSDSALYPINLILGLIFPIGVAYNLSVLLHYSLSGIFFYFFMRQYKLNKMACFLSGLIFMFSGMMITHRDHITRVYTIIWIPLILLLLEKYRKSKRIEFMLLASIPYAMSFFAGDPQLFLYSSIVILFFILYYSLIYRGIRNLYFLSSLSIFLLGVLIISVQLIPSIIMMQNSYRSEISYTFFSDFSFNPKLHPLLFMPFFFGRGSYVISNIPKYFGDWNAGEMIKYFGILTMPLVILGIFKRNKHKYLWLFIMALSLLLVLGRYTPFYKLMYEIPLYNKFRVPARNWFEFGLAFSILAGFGFDSLFKNDKRIKKILIGAIVFVSAILIKFFIFFMLFKNVVQKGAESFLFYSGEELELLYKNLNFGNYSVYAPLSIMIITIILFTVLIFKRNKILLFVLIIFIFLDLFSMGHFMDRPRDMTYLYSNLEESEEFDFLSDDEEIFRIYPQTEETGEFKFYPNRNIHYGLESIMGHDPILLRSYGTITKFPQDPSSGIDWRALLENNKIISMLNTKYIFIKRPSLEEDLLEIVEDKNYQLVLDNGDILVLKNLNCLPRFYFVKEVIEIDDIKVARDILWGEDEHGYGGEFNPSDTALVEDYDYNQHDFNSAGQNIEIIYYKNNSVKLNIVTKEDSFMVFSDNYYPGWSAFINGERTDIYKVNGILKGVIVPAGNHEVIFRYRPPYFMITGITSIVSLILIAGFSILFYIRKKRKEIYRKDQNDYQSSHDI